MSISSQTSRVSYTGNGNNDTYAYTFKIFDEDDLTVKVREVSSGDETTLVKTTDYTVTGVGETLGGNIVLVDNSQAWIDAEGDLDSGWILVIRRDPDLVQETDIRNQGTYYPEGIENQLDKLVHIDQKQQDELDRTLKLKDTLSPADFDMKLPIDIDTPDVVLATNSTGDGFAIGPTIDEVGNAQGYATSAEEWATKVDGIVSATDYSSKAWAIGGTDVTETASRGAAKEWAIKTDEAVDTVDNSAKAWAVGGVGVTEVLGKGSSKDWAIKTDDLVDTSDYSSKEWAVGSQTIGTANGGSSKDWANYVGGTVDDTEYSSKHYAQEAASEASDAAASAAAASAAVNSAFFRDVVYIDNTDSPVTLVSGDNGKIYVADTSGGAISVTLPQISLITPPFNIAFKLQTAGNDLTINRAGTDTIDGATTKVLSVAQTGTQMAADPDLSPDDWTSIDFGTVGDGTVTEAKLASSVSTSEEKFNLGLATSVSSNALTISLKQADGTTDPSSGSPVRIAFRHSTVTNGGYELINVTSALSTVISSGSTLGHTSGALEPIHVYALNNSGTVELCYSSSFHDESELQSTTAEGGAGAADSASVLYSTTARSNVPIRYLGRIRITEVTAGTWASNAVNINTQVRPRYRFGSTQIFSSSGVTSWTMPEGCVAVRAKVLGGGGGGGGAVGTAGLSNAGCGGGGGGYSEKFITLGLNTTETITVGAGGTAGASSGTNGGTGGTSSFGSLLTATGGTGGTGRATASGSDTRAATSGGPGGNGLVEGITVYGDRGQIGIIFGTAALAIGGAGGKGAGPIASSPGSQLGGNNDGSGDLTYYGGGGGGASTENNATDRPGGVGGDGLIVVEEYYQE